MAPDSAFEAWLAERADFAATSLLGLTLRPTFDAGWDAAVAARPAPAAAPRERGVVGAVLRELEWRHWSTRDGDGRMCLVCERDESRGHAPDCRMAAALAARPAPPAAPREGDALHAAITRLSAAMDDSSNKALRAFGDYGLEVSYIDLMVVLAAAREGEEEDEDSCPCTVCGAPGPRWGERHVRCGRAVMEAERRGAETALRVGTRWMTELWGA